MKATAPLPIDPFAARRRWPTLLLLGIGLLLWAGSLLFQDAVTVRRLGFTLGVGRWVIVALVAGVAAVPVVARAVVGLLERVSDPTARQRCRAAVAIAVVAALYLMLTAHLQGRDLFAKTHDDQSYLIQMQMLARFRLWMPQHELADFFDTFYVINRPVYASLYFPGAALLYVPTVWLGLPTWFMPTLVAGACVGLVYRIVTELVDGGSGLLAALAMVSLEWFRVYSVLLTSHEPMLLMGLLLIWAWLNWRRALVEGRRSWPWAVAIGATAGWGAITRPADAVCFALPVGVAMLFDLFRPRAGRRVQPPAKSKLSADVPEERSGNAPGSLSRRLPLAALLVVAGAAPFLGLQLVFNKGVTGDWLETPYTFYLKQDQPNTSFGFHEYDPEARPASRLQQKQDYYDQFFAEYIMRHNPQDAPRWWGRVYLPMSADTALPARLALVLVPVGLLPAVRDRRRLAVVGIVPLFLLVYYFNTFFLEHYALFIAPALLLLTVLGIRQLAAAFPRASASIRASLSAGFVALCVLILPEWNPLWAEEHQISDETAPAPLMVAAKVQLPLYDDLKRPAVVLFRYRFGDPIYTEPVYNTDVAWPDDAPIVYAHDLGPRNQEIFRYYAERQPDRFFYLWDRAAGDLKELGYAKDLAR